MPSPPTEPIPPLAVTPAPPVNPLVAEPPLAAPPYPPTPLPPVPPEVACAPWPPIAECAEDVLTMLKTAFVPPSAVPLNGNVTVPAGIALAARGSSHCGVPHDWGCRPPGAECGIGKSHAEPPVIHVKCRGVDLTSARLLERDRRGEWPLISS